MSEQNSAMNVIILHQRKNYNCFWKIFCCKCLYCCQGFDFQLLTSQKRKDVFQKLVKKYLKSLNQQEGLIVDPFFIMVALLLGQNNEIYNQLITHINDQKQRYSIFSKQDLQFYIPQLCTYLVFHQQMNNCQLFNLMERACKIDINFSFKYYFYLKALQFNDGKDHQIVKKYNNNFKEKINLIYKIKRKKQQFNQQNDLIRSYSNRTLTDQKKFEKLEILQIINYYQNIFNNNKDNTQINGLFNSTIYFYNDLIEISRSLIKSSNRKQLMYELLRKLNRKLPAAIHIPFTKQCYQKLCVLGIVYQECKVFNTKQRAPFYLCLQTYLNPVNETKGKTDIKIKSTITQGKVLRRSRLFSQDSQNTDNQQQSIIQEKQIQKKQKIKDKGKLTYRNKQKTINNNHNFTKISTQQQQSIRKKHNIWDTVFKLTHKAKQLVHQEKLHQQQIQQIQHQQDDTIYIFGQSQQSQFSRVSTISPYSDLPGYNLVHIIIKTNDNLKQQAFAMQLLQEFAKIFKNQKIPIKLTPYQVIPLDHDAGIIQCIKDSITIDQLRKKDGNLGFITKDKNKIKNFINSLAGYSLITYLLQVKDRHNGNIMIKKDGTIFHIDYGFFISNSPGKGVEIQKNIPFKLTNQYVQAMGGSNSKYFAQFRKLFYQGYNACRKYQHRVLILAKLMYSSYGTTMPCFIKGAEAISGLQERFNPVGVHTDADLSLYCQNIINSSIDNWRARWYDKWQYYMQGILY